MAFLFTVLAFPVRAIGWVLTELPRSVVGWERVSQVLTATGDMRYGPQPVPGQADTAVSLAFRDVGFAYDGGSPVLRDVTFDVPAGKTVALVGPTGSGKSTIASLAARLVDPAAGRIEVGGVDARDIAPAELAAAWRSTGPASTMKPPSLRCGWRRPTGSCTGLATDWPPPWANVARRCRAASGSASLSPGHSRAVHGC